MHNRNGDGHFRAWNNTLDLGIARQAARHVIINSTPYHDYGWPVGWGLRWKGGQYPNFSSIISRIAELPNLRALRVTFSSVCHGFEIDDVSLEDSNIEGRSTRISSLKAVFEAMAKHAANPGSSAIRSLTLVHLQNLPIPEITSSDTFKQATKDVDRLHLFIAVERGQREPDDDMHMTSCGHF
ncbi:hypothetical protein ACJ41O_001642 [Fusarium nematophilum]